MNDRERLTGTKPRKNMLNFPSRKSVQHTEITEKTTPANRISLHEHMSTQNPYHFLKRMKQNIFKQLSLCAIYLIQPYVIA